jgi:hypothetical protein
MGSRALSPLEPASDQRPNWARLGLEGSGWAGLWAQSLSLHITIFFLCKYHLSVYRNFETCAVTIGHINLHGRGPGPKFRPFIGVEFPKRKGWLHAAGNRQSLGVHSSLIDFVLV